MLRAKLIAFGLVWDTFEGFVSHRMLRSSQTISSPNSQRAPVPQQRVNLRVVSVLDYRDPAPEDRHAVTSHQNSVPLASGVVLRAFPDQIVQPRRVEPRALPAQGDALPAAKR